jgi:uncharacterized DUF497 family protein
MLGMTHKPTTYGKHAAKWMRKRGITRQDVQWVLARGLRSKAPTKSGADQRWQVEGDLARRKLRVVFIELANEIHIVSAQYRYKHEPKGKRGIK